MERIPVTPQTAAKLDAFLRQHCPAIPFGRLHKYLRENKIKVNGKRHPFSTQLCAGDVVSLYFPADASPAAQADTPLFMQARNHFTAVYETDEVLVGEKPAGLLVCDESGQLADTFHNRALRYLYENSGYQPDQAFAPCLCHRLDTGTSGLVLLAKTTQAEALLTELIRTRSLEKQYLCVTFGHPPQEAQTLTAYLRKDAQLGRVSVLQAPTPGAKKAVTQYEVLAKSGPLALLRVQLVTGRTHQIRAQLAAIGCPILGDSKYGNNAANRTYKLKYQALCAHSLTFPVISGEVCTALSGRCITAQTPWYVQQLQDGTLR